MRLSEQNLPLAKITASTLPGRDGAASKNGFKIGGVWLNGSDSFSTAGELHAFLMGKEITPSGSGKSLVVKGLFNIEPVDQDFLKTIIVKREAIPAFTLDLNSFAL